MLLNTPGPADILKSSTFFPCFSIYTNGLPSNDTTGGGKVINRNPSTASAIFGATFLANHMFAMGKKSPAVLPGQVLGTGKIFSCQIPVAHHQDEWDATVETVLGRWRLIILMQNTVSQQRLSLRLTVEKFVSEEPRPCERSGHLLTCPICGGQKFWRKEAQLNSKIASFLEFDWLNRSGDCYIWKECRHIIWF